MDRSHKKHRSDELELLPKGKVFWRRGRPHFATLVDSGQTPLQHGQLPEARAAANDSRSSIIRAFIFETLFLTIATACLLGFVILLRRHHNKETPEWHFGHIGITLNAVISIVSTVFRGSLLVPVARCISQLCWAWFIRPRSLQDVCYFDHASRGPLGSIRFLYRLGFLHFASLGALITTATVGLDPFFQQSVRYVTRPAWGFDGEALVSAAYTYDTNNTFLMEVTDAYTYLPYGMKAAIYTGVLSSNLLSLPVPPYNCPSGNCTWDPFSTLAVRAECMNITDLVRLNCSADTEDWFENGQGQVIDGVQLCNLVSPTDQTLQKTLGNSTPWDAFAIESGFASQYLPVLGPYANITGFLALVQWIKALGPFFHASNTTEEGFLFQETAFEAGRCILYFSTIEVSARVENGAYSEKILQEYFRAESSSSVPTYTWGNSTINSTEVDYFFHDPWGDSDLIYKPDFANKPPNLNNTFTVPPVTFDMLASQLTLPYLNGNIDLTTSEGASASNDIILLLYQASNVTRAMENLAHYMTTEIRSTDSNILQEASGNASIIAPQEAIRGTVWVQKQFVTVQWAWLTLPIILLIFAICLVLATFMETSIKQVGLWRSSPLTLFFHGRWRDDAAVLNGDWATLTTAEAMQDAAAGLQAYAARESRGIIQVYQKVTRMETEN